LTASITRQDFSIWMFQDTILTGSADVLSPTPSPFVLLECHTI